MRRVLVPLDGTDLAASILPDARRLAGPAGEIILMRDVSAMSHAALVSPEQERADAEAARAYLGSVAESLRQQGITVRTEPLDWGDAAVAIDEAAELLRADMIAIATHGLSAAERWQRGSVAWRALLRSTVPVLIRHADAVNVDRIAPAERRILVPLDRSRIAETALRLAGELASEWQASLWLIQVVPEPDLEQREGDGAAVQAYLDQLAGTVPVETHIEAATGPVVDTLVSAVDKLSITDIVMTTHGRTGVSRAIVGSIADEMIHRLRCPIVIIPALVLLTEDGLSNQGA